MSKNVRSGVKMDKEETTNWMNIYHDRWVDVHNKLIDIQRILDKGVMNDKKESK